MNGNVKSAQESGRGYVFPAYRVVLAAAVSMAAVLYLLHYAGTLRRDVREMQNFHLALYGRTGYQSDMDEKLSLAARKAAFSGDPRHAAEYLAVKARLDAALAAPSRSSAFPAEAHRPALAAAAQRMYAVEKAALRLSGAGNRRAAAALLDGEEYLKACEAYERAEAAHIVRAKTMLLAGAQGLQRRLLISDLVLLSALSLSGALWYAAFLKIRRWGAARGVSEAVLLRKEKEFAHFFNAVQEIFYRTDWKGVITDITPSIVKYSGFTREELIGKPVTSVYLNPADRGPLLRELLLKGMVEDYEVKLRTKERGPLDILVNARLLRGPAGLPVGIEGSLRDITRRKQAEEQLRRINRLYAVLSGVNEAIFRQRTPEKLYREICRIAVETGGMRLARVGLVQPGTRVVKTVAVYGSENGRPDGTPAPSAAESLGDSGFTSAAILAGRVVINSDSSDSPRSKAAARGFLSSAAFPLKENGVPIGAVSFYSGEKGFFVKEEEGLLCALSEDVSYAVTGIKNELSRKAAERELEQAREQLRQAQKMEAIGRLAGGIAHDFNNILVAILSYSELLCAELPANSTCREDALEITRAARRAAELTRRLLAFGRRQILTPKVVPVNAILRGMEGMLKRLIGENTELEFRLDEDAGNINADSGQIEQVVMNLVVNARDAIKGFGRITLDTAPVVIDGETSLRRNMPAGNYVLLAVNDTGSGIAAEELPNIFEPFYTTKEKGKGTGLGLATVYGIIKQSGGYVSVSSARGRGTSFMIYLPRVCYVPATRDHKIGSNSHLTETTLAGSIPS